MAREIKNKVIVVTGAAVGIGYEIAQHFVEQQAKVVIILDLNEKQGNDAVKSLTSKFGKGKAVFYKCDVTKDLENIYKMIINAHQYVDVLINNAGICDEAAIKKTIDINVTALIEWTLKFRELMRKDKGGKGGTIVNLASIYGFRIDPYVPVYQASKYAVYGFTRSIGNEFNLKKTGVRIIAICPGFTRTKLTSEFAQFDPEFQEFLKAQDWQEVAAVGKAAVDIYLKADSGSAWLIEGSRPVVEVPYKSPM